MEPLSPISTNAPHAVLLIPFAARMTASSLISARITLAPSAEIALAQARPIPCAAPVINAVRPFNNIIAPCGSYLLSKTLS